METTFMSQTYAKLSQTRPNPSIASVQVSVPHQARVQNPSQNLSQGVTDSEPSPAKRHVKRVFQILLVTLRIAPNVKPLLVIVFGKHFYQIVHDKNSVVVPEHEPPDSRFVAFNRLFDYTRHAYSRTETTLKGVRE